MKCVFYILLLLSFLLSSLGAKATPKRCQKHLNAYNSQRAKFEKCLNNSKTAEACEKMLTEIFHQAGKISKCLPPLPKGYSLRGTYEVNLKLPNVPQCELEATNWKNTDIYDCLAKWNFAVQQNFRQHLPKDKCRGEVKDFIKNRNLFRACMKKQGHSRKPASMKAYY